MNSGHPDCPDASGHIYQEGDGQLSDLPHYADPMELILQSFCVPAEVLVGGPLNYSGQLVALKSFRRSGYMRE
jgi:hypothetical protein